jgi:mono/diheme cytochrome c family protein
MRIRLLEGLVLALMAGVVSAAAGQARGAQNPPLLIQSLTGRDLFQFYCATCHGRDGKGKGPVSAALRQLPPDLTQLARRHGSRFPRERVTAYVTHGGAGLSPAHGTSEMPVWGPIFRGLDPSDTLVKVRIANVVAYIESMQSE